MGKNDFIIPTYEAVIIGNGDYPTHPIPLKILSSSPYIVCCDGGANAYIAHGHLPHLIIGDGDSLSKENICRYGHLLLRVDEQETNDQTKALLQLLSKGIRRIAIVAATGKREDHTLGNISLLIEYMRKGADVCMYTDYGMLKPCRHTNTFPCRPKQQVSIFNFTAHHIRGKGLAYPLYDFQNWWQGTLNECTESTFTIEAEGEYLVMLNYF